MRPTTTASESANCGLPDGVVHQHAELCFQAGYVAGVTDAAIAAARLAEETSPGGQSDG